MLNQKSINVIEEITSKVRAVLSEQEFQRELFRQHEAMESRLKKNEPININEGLSGGVIVYSTYEQLIFERERAGQPTMKALRVA